tara:strand:- start:6303 stop:7223 length:921 start_codon:yes stop_codon:yes gene_type:complete
VKLLKPNFWKSNNYIVFLIWPLTLITRLFIFFKNFQTKYKPEIPTICVGNIYLGGTGKTQLVIKLNQILKKKFKIFVVKKYYKNQVDEQRLLSRKTKLIISKKRIEGLLNIKKNNKNLAIFDDGLQDKSIKYSLSLVCFNSFSGFGNKKLLPAGPLRESLYELKNYDAVFINGKKNKILEKNIKKYNQDIKIFNGKYFLKNKKQFNQKLKYLAFCGIGTPENFFNLLNENKINVKKKIIFPDHFSYKSSDLKKIGKIALQNNLGIITTEKDFMKIQNFRNHKIKFTKVDFKIDKLSSFKSFLVEKL